MNTLSQFSERAEGIEMKLICCVLLISCARSIRAEIEIEYDYGFDDDDGPPPRLQDVPDKYYDDLLKEAPRLEQIYYAFSARRETPAYKWLKQQAEISNNSPPPLVLSSNTSKPAGRRIYQNRPWNYTWNQTVIRDSNQYITKKWMYRNKKLKPVASCYWCGMNASYFIPTSSLCHDAFESQDGRMRATQRFLRGKCYYTNPIFVNFGKGTDKKVLDMRYYGSFQGYNNMIYGSHLYKSKNNKITGKWGWGFYWDYGLKRNYFGQYTGGCFKRYLDVGDVYTMRGCRHYWPSNTHGANPARHRFKKLEYVLRWKKEGCVSSSHASLTPFNRGISLFARYYVCVCDSRYCNRAEKSARLNNYKIFAVAMLLTCKL